MKPDTAAEVIYHINDNDLLVHFNDQWNTFAEDNSSSHLTTEKIYNKSIWDFIQDAETRHIHEILLKKVRTDKVNLTIPFRCDSPGLRRYIEMNINPVDNGNIEYLCRLVKTEKRDPILLFSGEVSDPDALIRMCSWCKKIDTGDNDWKEAEEAIDVLGLFSKDYMPQISHTICDACYNDLNNKAE